MTINWLFVALIIGFVFVIISNKKTKNELKDFKHKEKSENEDLHKNR